MTIMGSGFKSNTLITITDTSAGILLYPATSDATGAFSTTFEAGGSAGQHIITASDGTDTLQVSFTMESQAPKAPALISPEVDGIAEEQAIFDWETVSDPSGVTYTLQVATKADFTPAFMILEKTGLVASEYTLSEGQALESTKKDEPYYWRVKATDSISNEGEWSTLGSFSVGSSFELTGGYLYALMGVSGLALLALGFWIGRRSASTLD